MEGGNRSKSEQLERAIDALEKQRAELGDDVVDSALTPLTQRLDPE